MSAGGVGTTGRRATHGVATLATLLSVGAMVVARSPAVAQTAPSAAAAVSYQTFTFDDADAAAIGTLSLLTVPVSARVPLTELVDVQVNGAWARGELDHAGETSTISGFTDTQLQLGVQAGWARFTAIALLGTGKATQTQSESRVAGAIAADLLPFAISNWGSGSGGGAAVSVARPVGPLGLGLSVAYLARQSFEPLDGETFSYRPGNLLRVVAAVDGTVADVGKATLQLSWFRYGEDELDNNNLFRSGNRFRVLGSYAFPLGARANGIAYAGVLHRARGTFLELDETMASQDLVTVGGGIRVPVGGGVLQPDVEARFHRRADGIDQGWDLGIGADYEIAGTNAMLVPSARAHIGNVEVRDGVSTAFKGFEVGLALRLGRSGS